MSSYPNINSQNSSVLYLSDFPPETEESDLVEFFKGFNIISCNFTR